MPLTLLDNDDEPTPNREQEQTTTTTVLDNEQELLELGDVPVLLPTSSNEIDSRNVFLSERGGLFDSDSDDELDLLSHHHYNTNNGKNTILGIENTRITMGIIILGLIFLIGFSLLFSYRMIQKPIERQSPKYIGLSLIWSTTVCKDVKDNKDKEEMCKIVSDRVKIDKNNFIISSFKPTTEASSCDDPNQSSYLGEKFPAPTTENYKKLFTSYAPYWPPSLAISDWSSSYDKYGRCLYLNDTAMSTPSQYFGMAIGLWQHWTNIYYENFKLTNETTEIPYSSVSVNTFAVPKCQTIEEKQYLLGLDICILGDTLQPASESTLCGFTTNCDTKKGLKIV